MNVYTFVRSPKISDRSSPWAVKIVKTYTNKTYNKRLRDEANLLRKMNNPYIVGFRQFSKNLEGKDCLAMEECTTSLGSLIERRNGDGLLAFPPENILKMALDISKALNYLHTEMLLLHADVKSHNILIKGDFDICKLCDFGVCLPLTKEGELDVVQAGDKEYDGTECWAAPEILQHPPKITSKADIFSYGLVLWEMMSLSIPHLIIDSMDSYDSVAIDLDESALTQNFGK